ncbi:ATP-binding protein [Methanocella sp. MCL-LM]|uniref:ATP-binding protein n=1 Tax=Methanocella sp. MCL-LM TaxID=3412035 RepID=UPI003C71A0BE
MGGRDDLAVVGLEDEIRQIQKALADYRSGMKRNVAIVSEPFSGKTTLIKEVMKRYGEHIAYVPLTSTVRDLEALALEGRAERIVAVDDCQYLFMRRIGGFEVLKRFLEITVTSEKLFLSVWNLLSWNYLNRTHHLQDYFPTVVKIPEMSEEQMKAMIGSRYDLDRITFGRDTGVKDGAAVRMARTQARRTGIIDGLKSLWWSVRSVSPLQKDEGRFVREAVFQRIHDLSDGNPGVALAIWDSAISGNTVRTSDITVPDYDTDLGFDESFVLSTILLMRSMSREDLAEVAEERLDIDRILYLLQNRGLIRQDRGRYYIQELAMENIKRSLKKARQVW